MQKSGGVVIPMKNVNFIFGSENIDSSPMQPFDENVCAFVSELSSALLQLPPPMLRTMSDLSALAFWSRKANLQKMKNLYSDINERIGRGLCFHIAPSNIPINFAFSYLFSLLAGNANIVRLPSKLFPQIDTFCEVFKKVVAKYPEIGKRTAFVRYPRDNEITAAFSKKADVRMIWGGDETIALVKAMPALPHCVDVSFADRYSLALISAKSVLAASATELKKLAENFYNDTYLMDQNACSSPQLILWENDNPKAREIFWHAVYDVAMQKYSLQDAVAVDKYTLLCEESISNENILQIARYDNLLYRAELKSLNPEIVFHRGKGGFFYEYALKDISELVDVMTEKYQTLTYFGVDAQALRSKFMACHVRGIDRIVPVGQAMNIDIVWDGHDLLRELSRIIRAF